VCAAEQLSVRLTSERTWRWHSETGHVVVGNSKVRVDPTGQMPTEAEQHPAKLRVVARQVIVAWKSGDLAEAMHYLAALVEDEACGNCGGTLQFWANDHAPDCTHLSLQQ
jgi:hypothetical protein